MLGRLLGLVFVVAVGWLLGRLLGVGRRASAPGPAGRVSPPTAGTMVRDRVCNTFLPRSRAIVVRCGSQEHFFCSEKCRSAWTATAGRNCA